MAREESREREKYFPTALEHSYGRGVAKLVAAICGDPISDYKVRARAQTPELCHFNLYPIAFKNTANEAWNHPELTGPDIPLDPYTALTGLPSKPMYRAWCAQNRFPYFATEVRKYKPRIIVGTGTGTLDDFVRFFVGANAVRDWSEGEITPASAKNGKGRRYYQVTLSAQDTTLFVVPFLGRAGALNSDHLYAEMGRVIAAQTGFTVK